MAFHLCVAHGHILFNIILQEARGGGGSGKYITITLWIGAQCDEMKVLCVAVVRMNVYHFDKNDIRTVQAPICL